MFCGFSFDFIEFTLHLYRLRKVNSNFPISTSLHLIVLEILNVFQKCNMLAYNENNCMNHIINNYNVNFTFIYLLDKD